LPNEIALSTRATHKFISIKKRTGLAPNILLRVALLKALEMNIAPTKLEIPESLSQKIPKDVAFGEYSEVFNYGIREYVENYSYKGDAKELITRLVETGSYKIANIKKFQDLGVLFY